MWWAKKVGKGSSAVKKTASAFVASASADPKAVAVLVEANESDEPQEPADLERTLRLPL